MKWTYKRSGRVDDEGEGKNGGRRCPYVAWTRARCPGPVASGGVSGDEEMRPFRGYSVHTLEHPKSPIPRDLWFVFLIILLGYE